MCECHKEDEAAYNEMVDRVANVNTEAAEWLRSEAVELDSFHFDGDLWCCFPWSDSPQGSTYWLGIAKKIEP